MVFLCHYRPGNKTWKGADVVTRKWKGNGALLYLFRYWITIWIDISQTHLDSKTLFFMMFCLPLSSLILKCHQLWPDMHCKALGYVDCCKTTSSTLFLKVAILYTWVCINMNTPDSNTNEKLIVTGYVCTHKRTQYNNIWHLQEISGFEIVINKCIYDILDCYGKA